MSLRKENKLPNEKVGISVRKSNRLAVRGGEDK